MKLPLTIARRAALQLNRQGNASKENPCYLSLQMHHSVEDEKVLHRILTISTKKHKNIRHEEER